MKKKIICLILSVLLILSILPIGVFAEGENVFTGQTFVLTGPSDSFVENLYSGKWDVAVGEQGASLGLRFKENDVAIQASNISWDSNGLPAGITVGGDADYLNISVDPTVASGEYTVNFAVNGAAASILLNVTALSAGDEETSEAVAEQPTILAEGENAFTGQTFIVLGPNEQLNDTYSCNAGNATSFGVRFKEGDAYVTDIVAPASSSLPAGVTVAIADNTATVSTDGKTPSGLYNMIFVVGGKNATVKFSVNSSSGGGTADTFTGQTFIVLGPDEQLNDMYVSDAGKATGFGVRFKEGDAYVTDIVAPASSSLPAGVTVTIADTTATVSTDGTTPSSLYNMIFVVGGKNATVKFSVNSSSGGGTPPPPSSAPALEYATNVVTPNWQPVPTGMGPMNIVVQKDAYVYFRIKQDGKIIPTTDITPSINNMAGQAEIDQSVPHNEYFAVKGGTKNGYVSISFAIKSNGGTGSASTTIMIAGNVIAPDVDSTYKNAIVKQSFANSGVVSFAGVSGSLDSADAAKGFALNGTTLSFDTASKAAGVYDAILNGQKYTVAIMNNISNANCPTRQVEMSTAAPASLPTNNFGDGIYVWNGMQNGNLARQVPFVDDENGKTIPIYLYRQVGGKHVSMDGYTFSLTSPQMDIAPFVIFDTVDINGIKVVRLSLTGKAVKSAVLSGFININTPTGFLQSVEFHKSNGSMQGTYAFTATPKSVGENDRSAFDSNDAKIFIGEGFYADTANGHDPSKVYLTKRSGDPAKYDFALYDEIDISTFKVESSNNAFIKVKSFLEKTPNGENAIGYELEIMDNTKVQTAEIVVSYNDKNGNPYVYYGGISCVNKKLPEAERIVTNVDEFKRAYDSLPSGKIIMEAGTYSMDFVHNKDISIVAKEGAQVIINGENTTNTGAIITIGLSNPGQISGVIIDGRNKTRNGINPNSNNGYAFNITIRNCDIGLMQTGPFALVAGSAVFENNNVAIDATANRISIQKSDFKNNGVAINYGDSYPVECRTHLNKFINNTIDFNVDTNYNNIISTQNYFQGASSVRKPVIQTQAGKTAKVYYSPYYINSDMTTLSADIDGAKTESVARAITKTLTLPVDRSLNSASVFDNSIFNEMKQVGNEGIEISIPVTEQTDAASNTLKVTTIWGFNNETGNLAETLPQTMNLEVKDTLSSAAQSIINNTIPNKAEIVKYVNFTHDGLLPGLATVKILKTSNITKENLKLYYINETTGKVEEAKIVDVTEQTIGTEVYYIVTVDHCSEYIIATANVFVPDNSNNTGTGGTTTDNNTTKEPSTKPISTTKPAPTKTQPTANNLTSAVEIENKFQNSSDAEVEINVTAKSLLSPKAFEILSEFPDKELVLKGEGYSWSFSGAEITNPDAINGASFDTTISFESPNKDEISKLTGDAEIINVYFNYHGELPGPAKIKLNIGKDRAGTTQHLYYFNDKTNSLEYLGEAVVDENGDVQFTITHCSDYLISNTMFKTEEKVVSNNTENTAKNEPTITQPETNTDKPVSVALIAFVVLIVAGTIALAIILIRKKNSV